MDDSAPSPRPSEDQLGELWRQLRGRIRPSVGADRADDVVQEAFLRSLRQRSPGENGSAAWLLAVARRFARRFHRREDNRRYRERVVAVDERYWPALPDESSTGPSEALRLLETLPEPYREVLHLRYAEGLEIEEISRRLGRSRGTVGSQIKRGLDRMRERLDARGSRRRNLLGLALLRWRRARASQPAGLAALAAVAAAGALFLLLWVRSKGTDEPQLAVQPRADEVRPSGSSAPGLQGLGELGSRTTLVPPAHEESAPKEFSDPAPASEQAKWLTRVHGIVVDARGAPVADAAVLVGGQDEEEGRVVGTTDARGRFELGNLDGRSWMWAEEREHLPSIRHLVASVDPRQELTLSLGEEIGSSTGRVLTADGVPVAEATVTFFPIASQSVGRQGTLEYPFLHRTIRVAPDGTFPFALDADGKCELLVLCDAAPPAFFTVQGTKDLVLPRGGIVAGRILSSDGRTVAGLRLRLMSRAPLPPEEAVTNGSGDFLFDRVPAGPYEIVLAGEPWLDGTSLHEAGVLRQGDSPWREIRLSRKNTLRGTASRDGQPLEGWIVELECERPGLFADYRSVRTDAQGKFAFGSCAANMRYTVRLVDPGLGVVWSAVVKGGTKDDVSIDGCSWATSGLRGKLLAQSPDDRPVFVELWSASRRWLAPVDPETGAYVFEGITPSPGTFSLRAWTRECGPVLLGDQRLLPWNIHQLDLTIPEPGSLRVHVVLPAGVDAGEVDVCVWEPLLQSSTVRGKRSFRPGPSPLEFCAELAPGEHECRVLIDGIWFETRVVSIEPGRLQEEIVLIPPFVHGTLQLHAQRPLDVREQFQVVVRGKLERRMMISRSGNEGDRLDVLLPLDTVEIEVRSTYGLTGEWRGQLSSGLEIQELLVTLVQEGPCEYRDSRPRVRALLEPGSPPTNPLGPR